MHIHGVLGAASDGEVAIKPFRTAVVVTVYNRAHFLRDALDSILAQSRPVDEVIVVDDGSRDHPEVVLSDYPAVRLLRQENAGPSAARNVGLEACTADFVLFLDADDILQPQAIELALGCFAASPGLGFVYGAHRRVDAELRPLGAAKFQHLGRFPHRQLLYGNHINMLGSVLFDRAKLVEVGGFDTSILRCEDYDLFLRMSRKYPVTGHPALFADYRIHDTNISSNQAEMLHWALKVQERHRPASDDAAGLEAHAKGKKAILRKFAIASWTSRPQVGTRQIWRDRLNVFRLTPFGLLTAAGWRFGRKGVPSWVAASIYRLMTRRQRAVGGVQLGDLARPRPVSLEFGEDRGIPVDRHYIEKFLSRHSPVISGNVLEVGDTRYSAKFGKGITRQDILHAHDRNPQATIVGDLNRPGALPEDRFDCIVATQTLHYIYDVQGAIRQLHSALRRGGTLLATMPGVTSVERSEFTSQWYWSFTQYAAARMFEDAFGKGNVSVEVFGNVYAATAFLHGLSVEDVRADWLDLQDRSYPVIIAVKATRAD